MTDFGETVVVSATFPQEPNLVLVTVSKPDGTLSTPALNDDLAPTYSAEVTADMVGTWGFRFEGTGGYQGIEEGYFVVEQSAVLTGIPKYTYDTATHIGQLRLLTDDRDLSHVANSVPLEQRSAVWSDDELQVFLNTSSDNVYIAAAKALTVLAGNRSLLVQSRRIGGTVVDYGSVRSDLMRQAETYREQAYADEPGSAFAEIAWDDFSARQIIYNDIRRNG